MQVDQSVLSRAASWLFKLQGPQGEFEEVGRLISTEMQGGLDNSSVGLTAYVLMALLEDNGLVVSSRNLCILGQIGSEHNLCTFHTTPIAHRSLCCSIESSALQGFK